MNKTESFIIKARGVHGDKYDYSLVNFKNNKTKVEIVCKSHGSFEQSPSGHLRGYGCRKCGTESFKKCRTKTEKQFVSEAIAIHGDLYDYSRVIYTTAVRKVVVGCKKHGYFSQVASAHLRGQGCRLCYHDERSTVSTLSSEDFICKAKEVHGDKYSYETVVYRRTAEKVTIICKLHGDFKITPNSHLRGSGCPSCANDLSDFNYLKRCSKNQSLSEKECALYLLAVESPYGEVFLKVGVTVDKRNRYARYKHEQLSVKEIACVCGNTADIAKAEAHILRNIRERGIKYHPEFKFNGHTECADVAGLDFILSEYKKYDEKYVS